MPTRSVKLSDTEAEELSQLLAETGESEEAVLRECCRHRPRMRDHEDAAHVEDDRVDLMAKLTGHAGNATASGRSR